MSINTDKLTPETIVVLAVLLIMVLFIYFSMKIDKKRAKLAEAESMLVNETLAKINHEKKDLMVPLGELCTLEKKFQRLGRRNPKVKAITDDVVHALHRSEAPIIELSNKLTKYGMKEDEAKEARRIAYDQSHRIVGVYKDIAEILETFLDYETDIEITNNIKGEIYKLLKDISKMDESLKPKP